MEQGGQNNNDVSRVAVCSWWHETHIGKQETKLEAQNPKYVACIDASDRRASFNQRFHMGEIILTKAHPQTATALSVR